MIFYIGNLDRQPRLAAATCTRKRDQVRAEEQALDIRDLPLAPGETCQLHRKIYEFNNA